MSRIYGWPEGTNMDRESWDVPKRKRKRRVLKPRVKIKAKRRTHRG